MTEPGGADPRSKGWESLPPWLTRGLALLIGIGLVGGFVRSEWEQIRKDPGNYVWGVYAVLAVAALYGAWLFLRRRFGPASSFKNPAGLRIGRKYLYGREEETEILAGRLEDNALVFLIGESGAGKSSLLERGLVPTLREGGRRLPLYLTHWGSDWIEGPRRALADAVNEALQEAHREKLNITGAVRPDLVFQVIARLHDELGLRPVLLLDQLDDYQARHRERFLFGPDRQVLRVPELLAQNPFWQGVKELLDAGQVHCVVATRDDAQWGLESVRFQEPGVYLLPLLAREHAAALLDKVAADAEVLHPERGWNQLRERLLRDLAPEGFLLPIQMKVALQGLAELQPVSLAAYVREGGLPGVEALHIARSIAQAARHVGWEAGDVRRLLIELVDPVARQKTVPRTSDHLLEVLPEDKRDELKLNQVLAALRDKDEDIVRDRAARDLGMTVWLLDHDYLCRGVLELDRRARRWQILLEESARSFQEAQSLGVRWRSLLGPGLQLRLFWERLRGRLAYRQDRGYAAFSALRLIGNIPVLLLAGSLLLWADQADRKADRLLRSLRPSGQIDAQDADVLWTISGSGDGVRQAVLESVFDGRGNAQTFLARKEAILFAAIGFDDELREKRLPEIVQRNCTADILKQSEYREACLALWSALPATPTNASLLIDFSKTDPSCLESFGEAPHLLSVLPHSVLQDAIRGVLVRLGKRESREEVERSVAALLALRSRLTPDQTGKALDLLLSSLETAGPVFFAGRIPEGLVSLAPQVSDIDARRAAERILEVAKRNRDSGLMAAMVVATVADRIPMNLREQALQNVKEEDVAYPQWERMGDLGPLWKDVSGDVMNSAAPVFLKHMYRHGSGARLYFGAEPPASVLSWLVSHSGRTVMGTIDAKLLLSVPRLAENLDKVDANFTGDLYSRDIQTGREGPFPLESILGSLKAADSVYIENAGSSLLEQMKESPKIEKALVKAYRLSLLGDRLPEEFAVAALRSLIPRLPNDPDYSSAAGWVSVLKALIQHLPEGAPDAAVQEILQRVRKDPEIRHRAFLLSLAANLGRKSSPGVARQVLEDLTRFALPLTSPPCAMAALVARGSEDTPLLADIAQWPTCSREEREELLEKIGKIESTRVDLWSFATWAQRRGLNLEALRRRPKNTVESWSFYNADSNPLDMWGGQ